MDDKEPIWSEVFKVSWDDVEEFYHEELLDKQTWQWLRPLTNLIRELRKRGYDEQLRAGTSIYYFVLSRSKRHGSRKGPGMIRIIPELRGMTVYYSGGPEDREKLEFDKVEFNEELKRILDKLLQHPIS